jgi:hypothetical protein
MLRRHSLRGARLLAEFLGDRTNTQSATFLGCSTAHVRNLVGGAYRPGIDWAFRIEKLTDGAVPAGAWLENDLEEGSAAQAPTGVSSAA